MPEMLLCDPLSPGVLTCLVGVIISTVGPTGGPWKLTVVHIKMLFGFGVHSSGGSSKGNKDNNMCVMNKLG